jgi:hypothetical protein
MAGHPHGDELGLMNPFSSKSWSRVLSSANSLGGIRYDLLEIGPYRASVQSQTLHLFLEATQENLRKDIWEFTYYRNILDFWYDSSIDPSKWFGWDSYKDGQENLFMNMAKLDGP